MKREQAINRLYVCPCCGYATISKAGCFEICELCFWEDDGQDDPNQDENWGGPNKLSLTDGRINYLIHGVSDLKDIKHVRKPTDDDINVRGYVLDNGLLKREKAHSN